MAAHGFVAAALVAAFGLTAAAQPPEDSAFRTLAEPIQLAQATAPAAETAGGAEGGAPDAGTDPSKAKRRLNFYHEHYKILGGDVSLSTTTATMVVPILGGGGTFGLNIPFTYADVPGVKPFGIGDVYAKFILLPTKWDVFKDCGWPFERVTPFFGTDVYIPSAENDLLINPLAARVTTLSLGTRKFRAAPLAGFAWQVNEHWVVIPLYQHDLSFAGDQSAQSVNQGRIRLFVQYTDPAGWYVKPEFQMVCDYHDDNRFELYVAPEVGKVFKGGTVFYVKPGYGFIRHDNNRDWGVEAGVRTVF